MMFDDAAYPPLNVPKPIAEGVWVVDATPIRAQGILLLPLRMTILRLANGDLVLYSPTQYRESLCRKIETFGPIRHLIAPSVGHWIFFADWQRHCPGAKTWAVSELARRAAVRKAGLRFDALLGPEPPADWAGQLEHVMFVGPGYGELDMVHRESGTLVLADSMLEVHADRLPALSRGLALAAGICAPGGRAPAQLRALLSLRRRHNAEAARRLMALAPRRIVFAHGDVIDSEVGEHLRRSFAWLLEDRSVPVGLALAGIVAVAMATAYAARRRSPRHRS